MHRVISRFLKHLQTERNARPATISAYGHDLGKFHEYLVQRIGSRPLPGDVTREHIRDYLSWLAEVGHKTPNGPATRARKLGAIRCMFKYAHHEGLVRDNPADEIPLPRTTSGDIRSLSEEECNRLLEVVESNRSHFRRTRDTALLTVFLLTGARLGELVQLNTRDIDVRQRSITLLRKGGAVHTLPLADVAIQSLRVYLKQRRKRTRTRALFISCRNKRISRTVVWRLVKMYFRKARIGSPRIGPHILRHTFATRLLRNGENLRVIQVLMSHKSLATTARYLHTRSEELISAVNKLDFREQQRAA